jgi:hypothetical protein
MKTLLTLLVLAASLGGCAIVPYDYGYHGDGYYRYRDGYYRGYYRDGDFHRDGYYGGYYYRDGYRRYAYQDHGQ